MTVHARGWCGTCGREVAVRADGLLRAHLAEPATGRKTWCFGSQCRPADDVPIHPTGAAMIDKRKTCPFHHGWHRGHRVGFSRDTPGCYGCTLARSAVQVSRWDALDPVAVVRAVAADPPPGMTRAERQKAVALLDGYGYSASKIARTLRISSRTVVRLRVRNRLEATQCRK